MILLNIYINSLGEPLLTVSILCDIPSQPRSTPDLLRGMSYASSQELRAPPSFEKRRGAIFLHK